MSVNKETQPKNQPIVETRIVEVPVVYCMDPDFYWEAAEYAAEIGGTVTTVLPSDQVIFTNKEPS